MLDKETAVKLTALQNHITMGAWRCVVPVIFVALQAIGCLALEHSR